MVVVANLWSGFGSALYALLAAGNRVIALTTEHSDEGTEALLCAFPAGVHLRRVEDIQAKMFQPLLRRRSASVILVGGKSPCHNPTSHQPHQLARLVQDTTNLPEVRDASTQVIGWLETTSSAPDEVKRKYDEIAASDFGWVSQNHTLWVTFSSGSLESGINRLVKLWPVFFSLSSPIGRNTGFRIRFTGPKPIPAQVQKENGFLLNMDPRAVVEARAPALHPFTEEFLHTLDSEDATLVAKDVLHLWRADGQRLPPQADEAKNIVWKGSDLHLWRTPSSAERLAICGFPVTALDEVSPGVRGPVEARRNTLIGRGFHLPSVIVLFTIMVLGASPVPRTDFSYGPAELFLRRRVHGTVFQPGAFHAFPGLITAKGLVDDVFLQLDCQNPALASQVAKSILYTALYQLQFYWIDPQLRSLRGFSQGPQWRSQVKRGRALATQSRQKITGFGKFGMGYLIPSGNGKKDHLRLSAQLQSPFSLQGDVDDDTEFVAIGQALLQPYVGTFRRLQEKASKHLVTALTPIHVLLQTKRTPEVRAVADVKNSALIAALATLLRWPDRLPSKVFALMDPSNPPTSSSLCLLSKTRCQSKPRKASTESKPKQTSIHTCVPGQHHQKILEATIVEQQRGWSGPFRTANDLNKEFGAGMWRFIPRFLLQHAFVIGSSTTPRKGNNIILRSALKRFYDHP